MSSLVVYAVSVSAYGIVSTLRERRKRIPFRMESNPVVRFVSDLKCNFFNFVPEHRVGVMGPIMHSLGLYIAMYRLRIVIITLGREIFRSKHISR